MDERRQARHSSQRDAANPSPEDSRIRYENARKRLIEIGVEVDSRPSPLVDDATKPSYDIFRRVEGARAAAIGELIKEEDSDVAKLLISLIKSKHKPKDDPQT